MHIYQKNNTILLLFSLAQTLCISLIYSMEMQEEPSAHVMLCEAAGAGNISVLHTLLKDHHGLINKPNRYGATALMLAATYGRTHTVRLFLSIPTIDVNLQDHAGDTALIIAASWGYKPIVRILLKHPSLNVNMQNRLGNTALMYAAHNNQKTLVHQLLAVPGLDPNMVNMNGTTALLLAQWKKHITIVRLLLDDARIHPPTQQPYADLAYSLGKHHRHYRLNEAM